MMNILLPTDFSENAYNAICHSVELYKNQTCTFYLLHTYTPAIYRFDYVLGSPGQVGLPDDHQHIVETRLDEIGKKVQTKYNNSRHTFVAHAAFNDLISEINKMVQNENIDIVVMGTQGATGAKEIFLGSNTVHVLKKAKAPVLTIPENCKFKGLSAILFPTDLEIDYSLSDLDHLAALTKNHAATVHIMHVSSPDGLSEKQKENKTMLENIFADINCRFHDLPDQELINAINNFQNEQPIQLLTMVHNKHTFLERLFIEPVIRKIGLHSMVPFLVLPYENKS